MSAHVTLVSFGYKHGEPPENGMLVDARVLRNPYYVQYLRNLDGLNKSVQVFVRQSSRWKSLIADTMKMVLIAKMPLTIAVGCTGGRHRSVTVVEKLAEILHDQHHYDVSIRHRELD